MTVLKDISVIWSLLHGLIMFFFLFEPKYSSKKTFSLTAMTIGPLAAVNVILFIIMGFEKYGTLMLLTLSLPSCIVFYFLSKYKDGRFFFTFCMVDTVVLEILYVTNIFNHYLTPDTYITMFVIRLVSYPLIVLWIYKKLRSMYREVQNYTKKGWGGYAIIGAVFYLAIKDCFFRHLPEKTICLSFCPQMFCSNILPILPYSR